MSKIRETIVYMVTNKVNGKRYIGVTSLGLKIRKKKHIYNAFSVSEGGKCPRFHSALRKYGVKAFLWKVLETFAIKELAYHHEYVLVKELKPEYNAMEGGKHSAAASGHNRLSVICLEDGKTFKSMESASEYYGVVNSEVSKSARGKGLCDGKHFQLWDGVPLSFSERMKRIKENDILRAQKRRRVADRKPRGYEQVINGRDKLGRRASGPLSNRKEVICLDDGKVFPSVAYAAKEYDVAHSSLVELCLGKNGRQTVGGKHFAYVKDIGQRWFA